MFQQWCTCTACCLSGGARGKKWIHKVDWYSHCAYLRKERLGQAHNLDPTPTVPAHPSQSAQSMDERSNDLFFATAVEESRDPRHVVLTSRSTVQPDPSALPAEALDLKDVVEGISAVRQSISLRASPTDKREAHRATVTAEAQLSRVEEHLCRLSSSLVSPSKELLSKAERDFREISLVVGSIRRVTPSLDRHKSVVRKSLESVQARILELRNLYPEEAEQGPVFYDSSKLSYHLLVEHALNRSQVIITTCP